MSQVITANRLRDGTVVFFTERQGWVEILGEADSFDAKDAAAAALAAAKGDEERNVVVDVYAIDVSEAGGARVPTKLREAIRARGPTIHPEFGKPALQPPQAPEDGHVSV